MMNDPTGMAPEGSPGMRRAKERLRQEQNIQTSPDQKHGDVVEKHWYTFEYKLDPSVGVGTWTRLESVEITAAHPRKGQVPEKDFGQKLWAHYHRNNHIYRPIREAMEKAGQEMGALIYHQNPTAPFIEFLTGREGPQLTTKVGEALDWSMLFLNPGSAPNKVAKLPKAWKAFKETVESLPNFAQKHGDESLGFAKKSGDEFGDAARKNPLKRTLSWLKKAKDCSEIPYGCAEVADKAVKDLGRGAEFLQVTSNEGYIENVQGVSNLWGWHVAAIKDGNVFDRLTGGKGMKLDDYKMLFNDRHRLDFLPVERRTLK